VKGQPWTPIGGQTARRFTLKLTWEAAEAASGAAGALIKLLILSGARRNEMTPGSR